MNNHVDNVFKIVMNEVEKDIERFADHAGITIEEFEYDLDNVYLTYSMISGGKTEKAVENSFNKSARKISDNMMFVKDWGVALNYIQKKGVAFEWDEKYVNEVLPVINNQISIAVKSALYNMEDFVEDIIVDYEENDEKGEYSYFVGQSDIMDILNNLKVNIETRNELYWTDDKVLDMWEKNRG